MKIYFIILFLTILSVKSYTQDSDLAEKLISIQFELVNKLSVGSSTDEIKKLLGKSYAVEVGFPNSDEFIFYSEFYPEQAGQSNYSTWFYRLTNRKINYTVYADTTFFINSEEVSPIIYNYYFDKDSVYYWPVCSINSKNVSLELYNFYWDKDSVYVNQHNMIDLPSTSESPSKSSRVKKGVYVNKVSQKCDLGKLASYPNDIENSKDYILLVSKTSQNMQIKKQHSQTDTFLPILCVIFEKGTNVVAQIKVYFQWL